MLGSRRFALPLLVMALLAFAAPPAQARTPHRAKVHHTAHRTAKASAHKAKPKAEKILPRGEKDVAPRPGNQAAIEASPFGLVPGGMDAPYPYAVANELGARWVHEPLILAWDKVQRDPSRISYDFAESDRLMSVAPQGLPLVWTLSVSSPEDMEKGSAFTAAKSYVPLKADMFAIFVRTLVSRYGKGWGATWTPVHYWQIEDAPSPAKGEHYADMALLAVNAMKEVDPSAKIVLGVSFEAAPAAEATKSFDEGVKTYLKPLGAKGVDVVNLRWNGKAMGDEKTLAPTLSHVQLALTEAGLSAQTPIWVTFSGPAGEGLSEAQKASDLVQRYVTALQLGVQKVFWAGALLGPGRLPKQGFYAYKLMTEKLEGAKFPLRVVWNEDQGLKAYGLARPDGKETLIAWSDEEKPSWTALPYPDAQAKVTEAVPDDKGNIRTETVKVEDARLLVDFSKGPVYIEPVSTP